MTISETEKQNKTKQKPLFWLTPKSFHDFTMHIVLQESYIKYTLKN